MLDNADLEKHPENLIIPIELARTLYSSYDADLNILDKPDQVYGKALHGKGEIHLKNGNSFHGEIHNGMLHGIGSFKWKDGVEYTGNFSYNSIEGEGKYIWNDGSTYEGCLKNNLRDGKGKYKSPGNDAEYDGEWQNGKRQGFGKLTFKSGAYYEGEFQDGEKYGQGKFVYPSQNYYEGQWKNDKKNGTGTMNWIDANEKYYGEWRDNLQNGYGVHIWLEKSGEGKLLRNRYEGQWYEGKRQGYGVFYYANGSKYEGEWKNNLKDGFAIFTQDNGDIVQGYFKADRLFKQSEFKNEVDDTNSMILNESIQGTANAKSPRGKTNLVPIQTQSMQTSSRQLDKSKERLENPQIKVKSIDQDASIIREVKGDSINRDVQNTSTAQDKHQNTSQAQEKNPSTNASKIIATEAPKQASAKQKEKTEKELAAENKKKEKSKQKDLLANPYEHMVDFKDLVSEIEDKEEQENIVTLLQTILLRHNSKLKGWYKYYQSLYPNAIGEDAFAMDMHSYWMFLRENKVLNSNVSLADVNRLFYSGEKNRFDLHLKEQDLIRQTEIIKSLKRPVTQQEIKEIGIIYLIKNLNKTENVSVYDLHENKPKEEDHKIANLHEKGNELKDLLIVDENNQVVSCIAEDSDNTKLSLSSETELQTSQVDMHEPGRCILFRHFSELVVRTTFIKYGNILDLPDRLEQVIVRQIGPAIEGKKQAGNITIDNQTQNSESSDKPKENIKQSQRRKKTDMSESQRMSNSGKDRAVQSPGKMIGSSPKNLSPKTLKSSKDGFFSLNVLNVDDPAFRLKTKQIIDENQDLFETIFNNISSVNRQVKYGTYDKTTRMKHIISILKNCDLYCHELMIGHMERNYDPDYTQSSIDYQIKERDKAIEKERKEEQSKKKKKGATDQSILNIYKKYLTDQQYDKKKGALLSHLYELEIIFPELQDLLTTYLLKTDQLRSIKTDQNQKEKMTEILTGLSDVQLKGSGNRPHRNWPNSIKDIMKEQLALERIKQKEKDKEVQRIKEEKRKEHHERMLMKKEDHDVLDDDEMDDGDY